MEERDDLIDLHDEGMPQKRPTFLTVICILTFIGSGLGLLGAIVGIFSSDMNEETFRMASSTLSDTPFGGFNFEEMIRWQKIMNLSNLGGAALCLTGALLMWKLKKIGYFIYVPGALIPSIIGFIGIQKMMSGMMAGFGMIGVVAGAVFSVAFIIMYGANLKHMK